MVRTCATGDVRGLCAQAGSAQRACTLVSCGSLHGGSAGDAAMRDARRPYIFENHWYVLVCVAEFHSSVHGPCLPHHRSHHRSFGRALCTATSAGAITPEVHETNSGTGPGQILWETGYGQSRRGAARICGGKRVCPSNGSFGRCGASLCVLSQHSPKEWRWMSKAKHCSCEQRREWDPASQGNVTRERSERGRWRW